MQARFGSDKLAGKQRIPFLPPAWGTRHQPAEDDGRGAVSLHPYPAETPTAT
jgi:hypothetical protein